MKTAMQELIDEIRSLKNTPHNKTVFDNAQTQAFRTCISIAKSLLTREREQIVEARMMDETCSLNNAEQYYSSKYEQK